MGYEPHDALRTEVRVKESSLFQRIFGVVGVGLNVDKLREKDKMEERDEVSHSRSVEKAC